MAAAKRLRILALAMGVSLASACAAVRPTDSPNKTATAIPAVETWTECLRSDGDFFGLVILLCRDPAGEKHDYGAVAYSAEPSQETYIGKLWGLKFYGRDGYNAARIRILLRLDNGRDFLGGIGARPEFDDHPNSPEEGKALLTIRLQGVDGAVGERTIIFNDPSILPRIRPRGQNPDAP